MWPENGTADRLRLYLHRSLEREYHVGDSLQMFHGKVTDVTNQGLLTITYDDGDTDDVTESTLLKIFGDMRKFRDGKRRRVPTNTMTSTTKRMR